MVANGNVHALCAYDVTLDVPTQQPFADQISLIDEMASIRWQCVLINIELEVFRVRRVGVRLHLKCHHSSFVFCVHLENVAIAKRHRCTQ